MNGFKRYLKQLWVLAAALVAMAGAGACSKGNDMGKLMGQWQIMSIERPGEEPYFPDEPRRYYCFNLDLLQLSNSYNDILVDDGRYIGRVAGDDPNYTISFPYDFNEDRMELIAPWGIEENPVKMTVEQLNDKTLVMKVGNNRLTLRKF